MTQHSLSHLVPSATAFMTTPPLMADGIIGALAGSSALPSTVTNLQILLSTESEAQTNSRSAATTRPPLSTTSVSRGRTARAPVRSTNKGPALKVYEDEVRTLSPKARHALATQVINISLRVLSDASKSTRSQSAAQSTSTLSRKKPLLSRSGNTTPVPQTPSKLRTSGARQTQSPISPSTGLDPTHVVSVAECARLSFSYLRTAERKELPPLQLEQGMITLAGQLISLGLYTLACKELKVIKQRLESSMPPPSKSANFKKPPPPTVIDLDNLSILLLLELDWDSNPAVWPLAITYYMSVIRIMSVVRAPRSIEDALQYLQMERKWSLGHLILQQLKRDGDITKAVKLLESFSRVVLQLTPSVHISADKAAHNFEQHPSPLFAFKLQVLSLCARQRTCELTNHKMDFNHDLVEPYTRCIDALLRRLPHGKHDAELFSICIKAYDKFLGRPVGQSQQDHEANATVLALLSTLAEKSSLFGDACSLAERALQCCKDLPRTHARTVAMTARKLSVALCVSSATTQPGDLLPQIQGLGYALRNISSWNTLDCRVLLGELLNLTRNLNLSHGDAQIKHDKRVLSGAAAGFATLYEKSFPGCDVQTGQEIIHTALSHCGSNDDLLQWVSSDTARVLIRSGTLAKIAEKSCRKPTALAWTSYNCGIALGRLLKVLTLRAASSPLEMCQSLIVDDDSLESGSRGTLIEWQFSCALDVAHKPRYRSAMRKLLLEMLRRLATIYTAGDYPLRRSRVLIRALRARDEFPDLIPPHALEVILTDVTINKDDLGKDEALALYATDIEASLAVLRAFYDGSPSLETLRPSLQAWDNVFRSVDSALAFEERVDSPTMLSTQLMSLEQYFQMLGDDTARLHVAKMLARLSCLCSTAIDQCKSGVIEAQVYLSLGHAEKASDALTNVGSTAGVVHPQVSMLELQLCQAETLLALDKLAECRLELESALRTHQELKPQETRRLQRNQHKLLYGLLFLLQSEFLVANATPTEALRSAKVAVKIMNGIWAAIERNVGSLETSQNEVSEHDNADTEALAQKVSKLQLHPKADNSSSAHQHTTRGAAFWPVVRVLCRSLMHLADLYVHHGSFSEANHACEQAVKASESVGSHRLLGLVRAHQCRILILADRVEEAELCLARDDLEAEKTPSLFKIAWLRAKAVVNQQSDPQTALNYLRDAAAIADVLQSESHIAGPDSSIPGDIEQPRTDIPMAKPTRSTSKKTVAKPTGHLSKAATNRKGGPRTSSKKSSKCATTSKPCYMLHKLNAFLLLENALVSAKLAALEGIVPRQLGTFSELVSDRFECRLVEHESIMRKVGYALQTDFTFNSLQESTLAFPALASSHNRSSGYVQSATLQSPSDRNFSNPGRAAKSSKRTTGTYESLETLLIRARDNLVLDEKSARMLTTADTHKQWLLSSSVAMLTTVTPAWNALSPAREALAIDAGRILATKAQHAVVTIEREIHEPKDSFAWPDLGHQPTILPLTGEIFQDNYINILPLPWTAISLCLNEAADELYVARYRSDQPPFVLKLPFARQRSEDADEVIFDYHMGKAELKEIIDLANYTCHSSQNHQVKGAKTKWWTERESLDRRLQELLINVENIWFGGFKGIFSQQQRDMEQLQRFRKAFDSILGRHLPSRKMNKRSIPDPALNDHVLELFTALDPDRDGESELDESLADLLYFVVDILQFNGEHNAYDEVDFDTMAVEVEDALQTYHESTEARDAENAHLVLILDRRLQVFPWESLPCLEHASVSRVDSMQTLHACIMAMRNQTADTIPTRYLVSQESGSYILNPSSDLLRTEETLAPKLSKLADCNGWKTMVRREPSEDDFIAALATSSILLFFGHGSGLQYIRQRAVRRLAHCSEVIWLMGCSSGAVTEYGDLEPFAVPLAYLSAGHHDAGKAACESVLRSRCLAVVATLWDVTDKDIDRFSLAVGEEWGLWDSLHGSTKPPVRASRTRGTDAAPCTPEWAAKTPKTPSGRKTPALARTPARSRSRGRLENGQQRQKSLVEAVARSRDACYLRYLNGAAPVVYGVPVYLGD